jgi:hypothetical protein
LYKVLVPLDILRFSRSLGDMNPNKSPTLFLCALLLAQSSIAADQAQPQSLRVGSSMPEIKIAALAEGRQTLDLPDLPFLITMQPHCQEGWKPKQLSIGIADTRKAMAAEELQEGTPLEFELVIPARQLAPVVLEGFCTTTAAVTEEATEAAVETAGPPSDSLQIKSLISAQGSLRCATDDGRESVTYSGHSLDILLVCSNLPENADETVPAIAE